MEMMNYVQESDYLTEESKNKFICESFKIDENKLLNQDKKIKGGSSQNVFDIFLVLALHPKHYGKTDVLEFVIH